MQLIKTCKFIKKPIIIEAMQLTIENAEEVRDFCGGCWYGGCAYHYSGKPERCDTQLAINIAHPDEDIPRYVVVRESDWVIKGIKGEFYPCRNDVFKETYNKVKEQECKISQNSNSNNLKF